MMARRLGGVGLAFVALAASGCVDRTTYRQAAAALPFRTGAGPSAQTQSEGLMVRTEKPNTAASADCKEVFNGPVLVRDHITATLAVPIPVSVRVASLRFSGEPSYDRASLDIQVTFDGTDTRRIAVTADEPRPVLPYASTDGKRYAFAFSSDSLVRMPQGFFERDDIVGHGLRICVSEVPSQKPPEPAPGPVPEPPRPAPVAPRRVPRPSTAASASATRRNCPNNNNNCDGIIVTVSPVIVNGSGTVTRDSPHAPDAQTGGEATAQ